MQMFDTYQTAALRTAKPMETVDDDLLHAALGLSGEVGEFADALKKHFFYGAPLDRANCKEELGDILWYIALGAAALGTTLGELAEQNIAKLRKRYPEKFTEQLAAARLDKAEGGHVVS